MQDGVLAWVGERLAVCMRQSEDLLLRDYIVSAASSINAGGANGDNPGYITAGDFSLVASTLDTNNAFKFVAGIDGADKFGKICAEVKSDLIDFKLPLAA